MLSVDWLRHHPQHCALVAEWLYHQFPYEFSEQPPAKGHPWPIASLAASMPLKPARPAHLRNDST